VPTPTDIQEMVDQYDGEIAFADELIESIFSTLDEAGLGDAFVVFTADHGDAFMDHGMVWHESIHLYEELTRVPFIIRAGREGVPARVPSPVMHLDVAPTLLDLAEIDAPAEMQGRSLAPLLAGDTLPHMAAYSETIDWGVRQAVWSGAHKLVVDREIAGLELYDLSTDPRERADLSLVETDVRAALLDSANVRRDGDDARRSLVDVELDALTDEQLERLRSLGYVQ